MSTSTTRKRNTKQSTSLDQLSAIGVARQSSGDDGSKSIDDQIAAIERAAEAQGFELLDVYVEQDVSGRRTLDKRPGLRRAVADIEAGRAQIVVTAYLDRLVRSTRTQADVVERVEAAGGRVLTLDMGDISHATAASWTSAQMLGVMAESYARSVAERTAASKARNVAKGVPPFPKITAAYERIESGDDKGRLRQHPVNAPIVREACELRAKGMSYSKLQRFLAEHGIVMTVSGVEGMLGSPLLYGEIRFGDLVNPRGIADPVIDRALYRRMHKAKATRGRYAKSERLLARQGVLVCECGARMTVSSTSPKSAKTYSYYVCGDRTCKRRAIIAAEAVESAARDEAIRLSRNVEGRASAERQLEEARVEYERANELYQRAIRTLIGRDDEAATKEVLDALQTDRDDAQARHEHLDARTTPTLTVRTAHDWDKLTLDEQRGVIRSVLARVVVEHGRGDGRISFEARIL
jgi:site-specific DNA recombinase